MTVLSILMFILEKSNPFGVILTAYFGQMYYSTIIIIQFLNMFGVLSNVWVTLMYLLEQASMHLLGGTARSSDLRIVISFVLNFTIALVV